MSLKNFAVVTAFLLMGTGPLYAQNYPTKVITVIVPFAAGGPTDTVARRVAVPMSKTLKQQVIVENVGGAGGTIGANRVARAPADGYTLFSITSAIRLRRRFIAFAVLALCSVLIPSFSKTREGAFVEGAG